MFDITSFTEKEDKGLVSLIRITDDAFAASFKKFDPDTGEELSEVVVGGVLAEFAKVRASLQVQIDEIDAFVSKVKALTPQNK